MSNLIIIPTYNEKKNIQLLLPEIYSVVPDVHILIVDDNSPDGTAHYVEQVQPQYPGKLHLLNRPKKMGLGAAYLAGFHWALQYDYQHILQMDADFSHNPKYLPQMIALVEQGADLVIGSRYVTGGGIENWSWLRRFISRGGNYYAKIILGVSISDITGGFKCYKRHVLEAIKYKEVRSLGYVFQIELNWRAWIKGFEIIEIPIIFPDRTRGKSKMSKNIFFEAVRLVPLMRWNKRRFL